MTRILLIRHGQTEWNRIERFRGQIDVPLNGTGRRQAEALATRLADSPIAAVYAGPLSRARDTAKPIADALGLPVQVLDGFLDINYGAWAGLTPQEAAERDPEMARLWRTAPHRVRPAGGESLDDIRERALASVSRVIEEHPDDIVVAVGHQVVNKVLLCAIIGLDNTHFWRIRQDNACLNILEYRDGVFEIVTLNDTCHLTSA